MDRTFQDDAQAIRTAIDRFTAQLRFCIPAKVIDFDEEKQLATCVPAVRKLVTKEGKQEFIDLPSIIKVPVIYPHAQTAGFALTLPIKPGDQVLLCVADRSIDKWVDFGEIQNPHEPVELRHNDLTDSLAIIGATPCPFALANYQTDGIELRNKNRSVRVKVTDSLVELVAGDAKITVNKNGDIILNAGGSTLTVKNGGDIITNVDIVIDGISFLDHVHGGVLAGAQLTDIPQ